MTTRTADTLIAEYIEGYLWRQDIRKGALLLVPPDAADRFGQPTGEERERVFENNPLVPSYSTDPAACVRVLEVLRRSYEIEMATGKDGWYLKISRWTADSFETSVDVGPIADFCATVVEAAHQVALRMKGEGA